MAYKIKNKLSRSYTHHVKLGRYKTAIAFAIGVSICTDTQLQFYNILILHDRVHLIIFMRMSELP